MNLSDFLIMLVIVSMAAAGIVTFVGGLGDNYDFRVPRQINDTYNQLPAMESNTTFLTSTVRSGDYVTAIGLFPRAALNTLLIIPDFFKIGSMMMVQGASDLGAPAWFLQGLNTLIVLAIMLAITAALMRWVF